MVIRLRRSNATLSTGSFRKLLPHDGVVRELFNTLEMPLYLHALHYESTIDIDSEQWAYTESMSLRWPGPVIGYRPIANDNISHL